MKIIGWSYLIAFSLDAALSVVVSFFPTLDFLSDALGLPILFFTCIVFVLSCMNKLTPRKVFITLSGFYLGMVVFFLILISYLMSKVGPEAVPDENVLLFLRNQLDWYWLVHWCLVIISCVLAIFGFISLMKKNGVQTQ